MDKHVEFGDAAASLKQNELVVIDILRKKGKISSKNIISELTGIPWSSVSNIIKALIEKNIVVISSEKDQKAEEYYSLNPEYAYFVGVSIGTTRIKIRILDFNFNIAKSDLNLFKEFYVTSDDSSLSAEKKVILDELLAHDGEWSLCCNAQCTKLTEITPYISSIVELLILAKKMMNILGIAFVLPGSIDCKNGKIINSYVLEDMLNIRLETFLTKVNMDALDSANIAYCIDHNAKAAIVAENEIGNVWDSDDCLDDRANLMSLYLGYGIGSAYILNGKLYRGNRNEAGQIGHNQVIPLIPLDENLVINSSVDMQNKCRCGRANCLEHRIRMDVLNNIVVEPKTATVEEIKAGLIKEPKLLKLFATYLGMALCNELDNLSIDRVVFSGKFSDLYDLIIVYLNEYLLLNKLYNVVLKKSTPTLSEFSAAAGAAILAYRNYFDTV